MNILSYRSAHDALGKMTTDLLHLLEQKKGWFALALSGGGTAQTLFRFWATEYADRLPWQRIKFFWVDERHVSPDHSESNYHHAQELLFNPLHIDPASVFRIRGENAPAQEALRYEALLRELLPTTNGLPRFDCIILGVGPDAHTASIFPNQTNLLCADRWCAVAQHPQSGQKRVTLTGPCLLNEAPLLVPLLGTDKQGIVDLLKRPEALTTPAGYILQKAKVATVYAATSREK